MVLDNVKFLAQLSFLKTHEAVGIECETDHLCLDHCVCVCVRERERERAAQSELCHSCCQGAFAAYAPY
jgi:hypothetical protein